MAGPSSLFLLCNVLILDGSSEHGAQIYNKSDIKSIFLRDLVTSKESSNSIFSHMCAKCYELPTYTSTMGLCVTGVYVASLLPRESLIFSRLL